MLLERKTATLNRGSCEEARAGAQLPDGRQTAPYSPAPDSDHVLWTRKRLNHRTCSKADFSGTSRDCQGTTYTSHGACHDRLRSQRRPRMQRRRGFSLIAAAKVSGQTSIFA